MPAMWAGIGAAAGGLASGLGSMFSNEANREINAQQLAFAQSMAHNQYQWKVEDLRKAGLNPMLAVSGPGNTAPIPSMIPMQNIGAAAAQGLASGAQVAQATSAIQLQNAQAIAAQAAATASTANAAKTAGVDTDATRQGIVESQARTELMALQGQATAAQTHLTGAQIAQTDAMTQKLTAEISNLAASKSLTEAQTTLARLNSAMQGMTNEQFKLMAPELFVQAHTASQKAGFDLQMIEAAAKTSEGTPGTVMAYIDRIMNWLHIGANISSSTVSKQ